MDAHIYCQIRDQPVYRRECFVRGAVAAGYKIAPYHTIGPGKPGDVLLIWNRYGGLHHTAETFERGGGTVLVAENAYVGLDRANRQRYALARGGHNGQGLWPDGGPGRWEKLGIPLQPWRADGDHILICPNRAFGRPGYIMPDIWAQATADKLRTLTKRRVIIRQHPGNDPPKRPLSADLTRAWAVVIWSSSAGCEALIAGVPVFCMSPAWICKPATSSDLTMINSPTLHSERLPVMQRLAWAQWDVPEIESGEPFQRLRDLSPA
jgi:hypothetical protein